MSSTEASATSPITSALRVACDRRPPTVPRPPSRRPSLTPPRVPWNAGTSPKVMPVANGDDRR